MTNLPSTTLKTYFPETFYNSSIGVVDMFDNFDKLFTRYKPSNYPPYDIEKIEDNSHILSLAVAGFSKNEISIKHERAENRLIVEGIKEKPDNERVYTHKGIANRNFKQTFILADDVEVVEAEMENGLLTIRLDRIIPEEKQPKMIEIK